MTGSVHELHRRRKLNRLLRGFRRISRCGPLLTPLLLSNVTTWHVCLIPPVLLLRLIIRQVRLSPSFLLLLKISSSRTCARTVRLVIFTTDLHGVVTLREYVETEAPLPTVDVMAGDCGGNVGHETVSAQGEQSSSHQNQRRKLRRHKLKGRERNKHGCTRKINMSTPCVKNLLHQHTCHCGPLTVPLHLARPCWP